MRRGVERAGRGARSSGLDGGSRKPAIVVGLLILLTIAFFLFLPPFALLGGGDSGDEDSGPTTTASDEIPPLPEGLEAVSPLYEISVSREIAGRESFRITLALGHVLESTAGVNLYTYEDGSYRRVAPGQLLEDGTAVTATLESLPGNIIALRRVAFTREVHGWLPPGAELSTEANRVLSVLNPVDYAPAADGSLTPLGNQRPLGGQFRIMPTVRAQTPDESDAVNELLADDILREDHIQFIVYMVESGRFDGVDIDYRGLTEARGSDFLRFITSLADELHKTNKLLSVSVPFPEVDEAGTIDTGAYDWDALALAADYLKVMPERDQARYHENVNTVLRTVTETVDSGKIILVVSPYAVEKTPDGISLRTLGQAMAMASAIEMTGQGQVTAGARVNLVAPQINQEDGASGLFWDNGCRCVQFTWPQAGGNRTMWIENIYSVAFKLQLAARFELAGVAVEDAGDDELGSNIWPAILDFIEDGEPTLEKPHGDLLQPEWDSDAGTLQGGVSGKVTWTAPSRAGTYEISLVVSDGVVRMGTKFVVEVKPRGGDAEENPGEGGSPTATPVRSRRTPTPSETPVP